MVWQKYLGKAEDIVAKLEGAGAEPHMARVFSSGAVAALYQVATELAGECQDVTLILDKGNNSKKNILRLSDAMGFVGSLVPSHHPELLAVPKTEFVPMEGSQFGGVLAYRTKKEVFGAMRTVVVTYNESLYLGQMQGLVISMRKANERLRELKRSFDGRNSGRKTRGKKPRLQE